MSKNLETVNLSLAAAIVVYSGVEPTLITKRQQNGKDLIIFSFPPTDAVYRAVGRFNGNDWIPALEFSECLKRLRAQLNSLKRQAEGG